MVEVPLGFTHNFTNIGEDELVVLIWCNEEFDRNKPDTYFRGLNMKKNLN